MRDKEKQKTYSKAYYKVNKKKMDASAKAWSEANKEKLILKHKAYREANKKRIKTVSKVWRQVNKDKISFLKAKSTANIDKNYVSSLLGCSVKDLTDEIYELYSLYLTLKREIKK